MSHDAFVELAPRIRLYASGTARPVLAPGWLALAQAKSSAFGDGSHPTTRLCAAVLDRLCRQRQPEAVLDVGTGTGVLARIARARGALFVVGTDIDAAALAAAAGNSALDEREIVLSAEAPDYWGARFDIVVANILEEPLRVLASSLGRALAAGGVLMLSGFTRVQVPAVRLHYAAFGLDVTGHAHLEDWVLLVLERRSPQAPGG